MVIPPLSSPLLDTDDTDRAAIPRVPVISHFTGRQALGESCREMVRAQGIPIIKLKRLPSNEIYPSAKYNILERHYDKLPPRCQTKDMSCENITRYHVPDTMKLKHTVERYQSAVIIDKDIGEVVAIVICVFAKNCFNDEVQPWGSKLILEAINRRRPFPRNYETIVQGGISTGARSCPCFGFAKNVEEPYDQTEERALCNLFGHAYSLVSRVVRAQLQPIADLYETVIAESGLVCLDRDRTEELRLLFFPGLPPFRHQPLCPPEVYITHNFSRTIHDDGHWRDCHMGV
jgi:hypothetical protein